MSLVWGKLWYTMTRRVRRWSSYRRMKNVMISQVRECVVLKGVSLIRNRVLLSSSVSMVFITNAMIKNLVSRGHVGNTGKHRESILNLHASSSGQCS